MDQTLVSGRNLIEGGTLSLQTVIFGVWWIVAKEF